MSHRIEILARRTPRSRPVFVRAELEIVQEAFDTLPQYIPMAYAYGIIVVHPEAPSVGRRSMPLHQYLDQSPVLYLKRLILACLIISQCLAHIFA